MNGVRSPFGSRSTAAEVISGSTLAGKRALVTGASSGIGAETALALAGAGAEVTLAVRDPAAGRRVADSIVQRTGNDEVRVVPLELANQGAISAFTAQWQGPLHLLIANAGLNLPDLRRTTAGVELTFAVCHLGHFALALGLREALASAGGARVVSVSSGAHLSSPVVFDDLGFRFRSYTGTLGYGQAKTANALFAVGLTSRWGQDGVFANAATPGIVPSTNLSRHRTPEQDKVFKSVYAIPAELLKSVEQGATTPVFAATSPLLEGVGGHYLEDCDDAAVLHDRGDGLSGVAPYALDPANAERLWNESLRLLGR